MKKIILLSAFVFLFVVRPVLAATTPVPLQEFALDAENSKIGFLSHALFGDVPGEFKKWQGQILFDAKDILKSSVEVEIDAASIDTDIGMRDNHLRGCSFFCVKKYPKIIFKSKKISPSAGIEDQYDVTGDLAIRDITKEITFPVKIQRDSDSGKVSAVATFEVNRRDFNVSFRSPMNPIKNEVTIHFDVHSK